REAYWDSVIGATLSLLGIEDANDICGRSLVGGDEWELKGDGEAVGVVAGTPDNECNADPTIQRCVESDTCSSVLRSGDDLCFTHHDRDFECDLSIGQNDGAMAWVAPLNMSRSKHLVGRDIGVEWEYSFMFPPHTDLPTDGTPATVPVNVNGSTVQL